jgi:hypothetical protein
VQVPKFNLEHVKKLVQMWMDGRPSGWFSSTRSSVDYVIHVFECTQVEAEQLILTGMLQLELADFCRQILIWGATTDEYGLENYLGHNWYVKFMVETDELAQISFHPCVKIMTLANGKTMVASIDENDRPSWRPR